jgi:hypothetical protein
VRFDGQRVTCTPAVTQQDDGPDLELAAPEFAQLYVGELSAGAAVRLGRATTSGEPSRLAAVDGLFHCARTMRLLDEF